MSGPEERDYQAVSEGLLRKLRERFVKQRQGYEGKIDTLYASNQDQQVDVLLTAYADKLGERMSITDEAYGQAYGLLEGVFKYRLRDVLRTQKTADVTRKLYKNMVKHQKEYEILGSPVRELKQLFGTQYSKQMSIEMKEQGYAKLSDFPEPYLQRLEQLVRAINK